jgi:hypothetical protein
MVQEFDGIISELVELFGRGATGNELRRQFGGPQVETSKALTAYAVARPEIQESVLREAAWIALGQVIGGEKSFFRVRPEDASWAVGYGPLQEPPDFIPEPAAV